MNRAKPDGVTKRQVLAILRAHAEGATCRQLSDILEIGDRNTRKHLDDLIEVGKVHCALIGKPGEARPRLVYAVAGRQFIAPAGYVITERKVVYQEDEIEPWLTPAQLVRPAGQWQADHIPAVRSVFDLGVGV